MTSQTVGRRNYELQSFIIDGFGVNVREYSAEEDVTLAALAQAAISRLEGYQLKAYQRLLGYGFFARSLWFEVAAYVVKLLTKEERNQALQIIAPNWAAAVS